MISYSSLKSSGVESAALIGLPGGVKSKSTGFFTGFRGIMEAEIRKNAAGKMTAVIPGETPPNSNKEAVQTKGQVMTYREVASAAGNDRRTRETAARDEAACTFSEAAAKQEKKASVKANMLMECLAQILGVKPEDLNTLLGFLGVKPEDLADRTKLPEIAHKLAELLNLDTGQEQTLLRVMELAGGKAGEIQKTDETSDNGGNVIREIAVRSPETGVPQGQVKEDYAAAAYTNKPEELPDEFRQILDSLKARLQEMTQRMQRTPGLFMEELAEKIEGIMKRLDIQSETEANNSPAYPVNEISTDNKEAKSSEGAENTGKQEKKEQTGQSEKPLKESGSKADAVVKGVDAMKAEGVGAIAGNQHSFQVPKSSETVTATVVRSNESAQVREIISQVIQNAKVVIDGDKTEMVMQLKPESLGKVSLKVVAENGIITARFIAENRQVKQILEANMQLLKDALEKQGLSVEGFSVSVGQDSLYGYERNGLFDGNTGKLRFRFLEERTGAAQIAGRQGAEAHAANSLWLSESSIDLIA